MDTTRCWTVLALLASLAPSRAARAELPADTPAVDAPPADAPQRLGVSELRASTDQASSLHAISTTGEPSHRGAAEGWLVKPGNTELTGGLRFVTAQAALSDDALRFSDLALFTVAGRYSLGEHFELSGHVELLPKQPSYTDENPWQGAGLGGRYALRRNLAIAVDGAVGPLLAHDGQWTQQAAGVQWRKSINDVIIFDLGGGGNAVELSAPDGPSAAVTELTSSGSVLIGDRQWAAWLGAAYSIPVWSTGTDATTQRALDPQPRLDFRVGAVAVIGNWDLSVEYAVIDRGDLADAATRLPILDGGFDQRQLMFGVTRHFDRKIPRNQIAAAHARRAVAAR